jgi:hypothetical protein
VLVFDLFPRHYGRRIMVEPGTNGAHEHSFKSLSRDDARLLIAQNRSSAVKSRLPGPPARHIRT